MHRNFRLFLAAVTACMLWSAEAIARDGFILICPPGNGPCRTEIIPAPTGRIRWYANVYVEGDGDLGRVRVANRGQCQSICDRHPACIVAEFYYGREESSPMCNLFSYPARMLRNTSNDAQVMVYE